MSATRQYVGKHRIGNPMTAVSALENYIESSRWSVERIKKGDWDWPADMTPEDVANYIGYFERELEIFQEILSRGKARVGQ
jgi:hypothetical protein